MATGNDTLVQIGADTQGYIAEIGRAAKSAADFITSQTRVKTYTENAVKAIDSARTALKAQGDEAVASFNKTAATAEKFLKSIQKQSDVAGKSATEMLRLRAAELGVSDAAKQYIDQIEKANTATASVGHGAAGARKEVIVLAHEMATGAWSNFGGSLLVLGERLDAMKYLLNPVALGIGALAAAGYVAYEAIHKLTEQQEEVNRAMVLTNNYAGITQGTLLAFSDTISKNIGVSTGAASDALLAMASSGKVAGADLEQVSESIAAYAKFSGQTVQDVAKEFTASYGQAGEAAKKWAETHHDLSQQQIEYIGTLEKSGDKAGAWKEFVIDASANARKAVVADNKAMSESYESLGDRWERFWRTVTGKGDELTKLHDQIKAISAQEMDPDLNPGGTQTAAMEARKAALQSQIDTILKANDAQQAQSKALNTFDSMNQQHIEDMKTTFNWQQKLNDANDTARKRTEALTEAAKAAGKLTPQLQAQLQSDLKKTLDFNATQYKAPRAARTPSYHEPRGVSLLDEAKAQQAVLQQSLGSNDQLTGWAAKRAALEAQIADYSAKVENHQGNLLTKQQASVLAQRDALLTQYKINEQLEADGKFIENITKLQTDRDSLNTKLQDANDALAQQQQIELQTATLTTEQRQRQIALLQVETDRRKELAAWARTADSLKLTGSDTDVEERRTIDTKFDDRRSGLVGTFNAQDALKGDWAAGARKGLNDIITQTQNLNELAQTTAGTAISSIGDAFAQLATTGKMSFSDLTKTIVASFIKMETEALAARAAMSFLNVLGFAGGGAVGTASGGNSYGFTMPAGYATGGLLSGPGTGTSDSIPIMASTGEYIMRAEAVKRIGVSNLDAMNSGAAHPVHSMARYATGGLVGKTMDSITPGGGGGTVINTTVNVDGGTSGSGPSAGQAADLQKKITAAVKAVIQNERRQGGALWKERNGVA